MSGTQAKPPVQLVSSRAWRVELVREKRRERRFFWTTASRGAVGHGTNLDRGMVRIRFPTSQYQTNLLYPKGKLNPVISDTLNTLGSV